MEKGSGAGEGLGGSMKTNHCLDSTQRTTSLQKATEESWDLLIIGGGITGAGIALDAAARGLKTILVEMDDYAAGTSSRSTKLIHGGLRYLKQFEFRLVAEVGKERAILHRNAPHVVVPEQMLLPVVKGGTFGRTGVSIGLWVYDRLAGVKGEERRKMLNMEQAMALEPSLRPQDYLGAGLYAEYRTDDARLTIEIIKTAVQKGAHCLNHLKVEQLIKHDGKVKGAVCKDMLRGNPFPIHAKYVVNAAGPWVDDLRKADDSLLGKRLHHTKGVHLVLPHDRLPISHSVYFDIPDGRMMFAIPRHPWTYIGTTDTDFKGDLAHPRVTATDVKYLLDATNRFFPGAQLQREDVVSSWAGIRPLIHEEGKSASQLSRKDEIFVSASGLLTIAGGKLTGYRKMAERITDIVVDQAVNDGVLKRHVKCGTDQISLSGGAFRSRDEMQKMIDDLSKQHGLPSKELEWLVGLFGSNSPEVMSTLPENPSKTDLVLSVLKYSVKEEGACQMADFFVRRTALLYFGRPWIAPVRSAVKDSLQNLLSGEGIDPGDNAFEALYKDAVDFPLNL